MDDKDQPQIYLITPTEFDPSDFAPRLAQVLDAHRVACVRLAMAGRDETAICRAADTLREITHARDVALVIDSHLQLVEKLGLDGVHLTDGARSVRYTRKELSEDAIVGAYCGTTRHDGMSAAESGADYVSFGPMTASPLGDGAVADRELFQWWSEIIEVPIVAEGLLSIDLVRDMSPITDFFAFQDEIWNTPDAAATLGKFIKVF